MSEKLRKIFGMVAPGTPLYDGLENILRARTGGLIVVGDTPEVMGIVKGGFRLDAEFSAAALYELAKMDGAIILSSALTNTTPMSLLRPTLTYHRARRACATVPRSVLPR